MADHDKYHFESVIQKTSSQNALSEKIGQGVFVCCGGSSAPPGDVNWRASGALFLASSKPPSPCYGVPGGLLDLPSL
jgi:hypothetical protein